MAGVSEVEADDLNVFARQALIRRRRFPTPFNATNWATADGLFAGVVGLASSGAGTAWVDLDIPRGYKLGALTLMCVGNASANLIIGIDKAPTTNAANVSLGALALAALSATAADQLLNMIAASTTNAGGQTVTVNAGAGTYTRSAGSFISDQLFIGQIVQWTGFANAGNNAAKTITGLSATVMTVSTSGLVNEVSAASAAQANGVSPPVDDTFALHLKLTASATALAVKSLRYDCIPI